jgi:polyisoprenoid-binding protein YceI
MWTMRRVAFLVVWLGLAGPAFAADVSTNPQSAPDGTYKLDKNHTRVVFMCSHFGISDYIAFMQGAEGSLEWVGAQPEKGSVSVSIDAGGGLTGLPNFDETLDGPDWFDAKSHPKITFKSTTVETTGASTGRITGDLTVRGITKPITLEVTFNGSRPHPLKPSATALGFVATGTAKRSDYEMTKLTSIGIGDEVKLLIHAEFIRDAE